MSRTYCPLGCVVLLALIVGPVSAETVRVLGMGEAMLAVGNDAGAWWNNVALTPLIDVKVPYEQWGAMANATTSLTDTMDWTSVDVSARSADGVQGFGAGYRGGDDWSDVGAGYARRWAPGFTGGVSVGHRSGWGEGTWYTVGLAFGPPVPANLVDLRFAAEYWNMTEGGFSQVNLGVGASWPNGFTVGFDAVDVFDMNAYDLGAEWVGPEGFKLRGGVMDVFDGTIPTAGVAYALGPWEIGVAWQGLDGDDYWAVGGTGSW